MKGIEKLFKDVINQHLCSGCGFCIGICSTGAIQKKDPYSYHPDSFNVGTCIECGLCAFVCPALGYNIYKKQENDQIFSKDIGYYKRFYSCSSLDINLKNSAAAGGVTTEILKFLIESKRVNKVVVVQNTEDLNDGLAISKLTNSIEEILKAKQSKYVQVPIGTLLKTVLNSNEKIAIVGLPCQLAALERAQSKIKSLKNKIVLKIAFFCGYTYSPKCINGLLNYMKVRREDVKKIIGWRNGGIPGNFEVELKNGAIKGISFIEEHNIDVTFYSLLRCHLCVDWSGVYSDLSIGDLGGWKRNNLVVTRTQRAEKLLQEMVESGLLQLDELDKETVWKNTNLSFMNAAKKERCELFTEYLNQRNFNTPNWDVTYHKKTFTTKLFSKLYFYNFTELRKNIPLYEKNPNLMMEKGKYMYQVFWYRPIIQIIRKIEKVFLFRRDFL